MIKRIIRQIICRHEKPLKGFVENQRTPKEKEEWVLICTECYSIQWREVVERPVPREFVRVYRDMDSRKEEAR